MSPDALIRLLAAVAPDLDAFAAPWTVIGSGALILLGAPVQEAGDLDVVTSIEGVARLRAAWSHWLDPVEPKAPDGPFRSDDFARYATPWGPVEVMGGLHVRGVLFKPTIPVPALDEQLRLLRLFGRPKDLARAAMLSDWLAHGH